MATSDYERRIAKLERARAASLSPQVCLVAKHGDRDKVLAAYLESLSKAALQRDQTIIIHTYYCVDPYGRAQDAQPSAMQADSVRPG